MKYCRIFLFAALSFWLASCSDPGNRVVIDGEITGIKMADFYVYCEDGLVGGVDTVKIVDGEFHYERELSQPVVLNFLYPNFSRTCFVAEPGTKLKVRGKASNLSSIDISGTKENELLTAFRQENVSKSDMDRQMAAAQFVRDHAEKISAIAVFKRYFANRENLDPVVSIPLLDQLLKANPKNQTLRVVDEQLRAQMNLGEGMKLPDFKAVNLKGDTISRQDFNGKPLLLVFWSTWISEGYRVMKNINTLESKYGDRLNILVYCVDFEEQPIKVKMRTESVMAPAVCEGLGFASPLVKTFGIRYVPGNLLVNSDGEIVKRDVATDKMIEAVADLMK